MVGWAQRYERELPLREGDRRLGKPRKWAPRSMQLRAEKLGLQAGIIGFSPADWHCLLPMLDPFQ